jgi:endonuclease G
MNRTLKILLIITLLLCVTASLIYASPRYRRKLRNRRQARVLLIEEQPISESAKSFFPWYEMPATTLTDDQEIITHYTTIDGERRRNFTMLYDHSDKLSLWVAYPMHQCYLGEQSRTDAWGFDPQIPSSSQFNMKRSGFIDDKGYSSYDRGHQIPSADRTVNREANAATFYYSNMTPQQSSFNRGLWGRLEEFVRDNTPAADTLWVVTGCVMTTPDSNTLLRAKHKSHSDSISVPQAYYKVLLRSSVRGALPTDASAECIGFWMPNAAPSSSHLTTSYAVSINYIEQLTGIDFFPGLSDQTESHFDPSIWQW